MKPSAREVELLAISDVHLGTPACRAAELTAYLKTVRPRHLVMIGDIVDLWHLGRRGWSDAQTRLVRRILKLAARGVRVTWITGNHDAALRRHGPAAFGSLELRNQLELDLGGVRTWFVHGDAADALIGTPAWLAALGSFSYDALEWCSGALNRARRRFGLPALSLNGLVKRRLASAQAHIDRFERTMARLAAARGCAAVVCGHIHIPCDRRIRVGAQDIRYLNTGDWVESLSALEYAEGAWRSVQWDDLLAAGELIAPTGRCPTGAAA